MATININLGFVATAGGTVDVITATFAPAPASLYNGLLLWFVASGANVSTTPTLNVNALGARTIVKNGGVALAAGDIPGALAVVNVEYNLANTRWEIVGKVSINTNDTNEYIVVACSDETTALTAATDVATFRMPYAMTLTEVRASLTTAGTGANLVTVDIHESGSTVLSTKITIDATEKTSTTAATPPVISDSALADDAEITIDIDQIDSGGVSAGLKVYLIGNR